MKEITQEMRHANGFMYLVGKKIKTVRYLSEKEAEGFGWHKRPLVIIFNDDSMIIPQSDDEGNDGGAMWYQDKTKETIIYTL